MKIRSSIFIDFASNIAALGAAVLLTGWAGIAASADANSSGQNTSEVLLSPYSAPLRQRGSGPQELPRVQQGLGVEAFARSLGHISAMALGPNGQIYVVETERGRLTELTDRDLDGRVDMTRILASGFNDASALVATEQGVFVKDNHAIWKIDISTREKSEFVSLRNIQTVSGLGPMILGPKGETLIMSVSVASGASKVISVNLQSGRAGQIASGDHPVSAIAITKGTALWAASGDRLFPIKNGQFRISEGMELPAGRPVENLYLPTNDTMTGPALTGLAGQFLALQGQTEQTARNETPGRNVVAIASAFGLPQGEPVSVIDGFVDSHGRSAWGNPRALVWDERGLFLADSQNGTIWKISKADTPMLIVRREKEPFKLYDSNEIKKAKASWGSSINAGSSIVTGSSLGETWDENTLITSETLMGKMREQDKEEMAPKGNTQDDE